MLFSADNDEEGYGPPTYSTKFPCTPDVCFEKSDHGKVLSRSGEKCLTDPDVSRALTPLVGIAAAQ